MPLIPITLDEREALIEEFKSAREFYNSDKCTLEGGELTSWLWHYNVPDDRIPEKLGLTQVGRPAATQRVLCPASLVCPGPHSAA